MAFPGKTVANTFKDILQIDNSNAGVPTSLKVVKDGIGNESSLYISDDQIKIKPENDDTAALLEIEDKDGDQMFLVDSTNDAIKAFGQNVNTQYAYFGTTHHDAIPSSSGTHTAVPFGSVQAGPVEISFGTGTDPAASLTLSTTIYNLVPVMWYVPDDITIDGVFVWVAADTSNGDTLKFHLMSYTIVTAANGGDVGDLSSGTVIADGANIINAGYEQADYQVMTLQSPDIDASKAVLFMIHSGGTNSDYSINTTIKYHLR